MSQKKYFNLVQCKKLYDEAKVVPQMSNSGKPIARKDLLKVQEYIHEYFVSISDGGFF